MSAFGTAAGLLVFAAYTYVKKIGTVNVHAFNWIPVASFAVAIFAANLGVLSLPFLVLQEILPEKVKFISYLKQLLFYRFLLHADTIIWFFILYDNDVCLWIYFNEVFSNAFQMDGIGRNDDNVCGHMLCGCRFCVGRNAGNARKKFW